MINAADVTACLVTRGDQPEAIRRIRESLVFDSVMVWDNSTDGDWKCAGRYKAAEIANCDVVYFQDDDVTVPSDTQLALLEAYEPSVMVANWGHGENPDGYDDLPLVCGGAVVDREVCLNAWDLYARFWPVDEEFMYEADFALGILYPEFRHLHLPFEIDLAIAQHPSRLCNQPWQRDLKLKITNQARHVRGIKEASEFADFYVRNYA